MNRLPTTFALILGALVSQLGSESPLALGDETPPSSAVPSPDLIQEADSVQDLLYCGPCQPLLIRLRLFVKGEGFRNLRRKWVDAQFAAYDADQNGVLEGAELENLPSRQALKPGMNRPTAPDFPADSDPADGKVTPEECRRYLLSALGTPFSIKPLDAQVRRVVNPNNMQDVEVNLFPKLDQNQDGRLSRKEMESAGATLRRYDRNEDDIVDATELQQSLPEEQLASRQQLTGVFALLLVVDTADGGASVARYLLEGYDKAARDPVFKVFRKDQRLTRAELPIDAESFTRADRDGDGNLDRIELGRLTEALTPSAELVIHAPTAEGSFTVTSLRPSNPATAMLLDITSESDGNWVLKLEETRFGLRAAAPSADQSQMLRQRYANQFKAMDMDKNDYLEMAEIQRFGFDQAFFLRADGDGNGKLFEKEYMAHVDREMALSLCGLEMTVASNSRSLFRKMDANGDGRLSLRELHEATSSFSQWDINGDQFISLSELAIQLEAVFTSGTARANGPLDAILNRPRVVQNPRGRNAPETTDGVRIPSWFAKMDRNGDLDLSPKEFLGRRALFDTIDTNLDGLISAKEAKAVDDAAIDAQMAAIAAREAAAKEAATKATAAKEAAAKEAATVDAEKGTAVPQP